VRAITFAGKSRGNHNMRNVVLLDFILQ